MSVRHWQRKSLLLKASQPQEQGFILALVVIEGLILAAGSISKQQSHGTREIAEASTSQLVEQLNRAYAYLPINDDDGDGDGDLNTTDWYNCKNEAGNRSLYGSKAVDQTQKLRCRLQMGAGDPWGQAQRERLSAESCPLALRSRDHRPRPPGLLPADPARHDGGWPGWRFRRTGLSGQHQR